MQSRTTEYAYLCHPLVQHVSKLKREGMDLCSRDNERASWRILTKCSGGFCGYRNIQMLISHIIGAQTARSELFGTRYPSILQIQDLIENAWDMGVNPHGRAETGGIRGTRKFIGTPEVRVALACVEGRCH